MCGISGIVTWSLLVWTTSLRAAVLIQCTYGTYIATEVAYYTYIYAKVDKEHYLKVTSHTRAAVLSGKFLSGILAQTLVYTNLMDLRELHVVTLGGQIAATLWAFFLPSVKNSLYFNREPDTIQSTSNQSTDTVNTFSTIEMDNVHSPTMHNKCSMAFRIMWSHFRLAYTNRHVLVWSFWYAAGMCGHFQVISYVQMLWISIDNSPEVSYYLHIAL